MLKQIIWSKEGHDLRPGGKYTMDYSLGIASLEISACLPEDAGRYLCRAENAKGSQETTCKVTVAGMRKSLHFSHGPVCPSLVIRH